jgi:transposase-like protein
MVKILTERELAWNKELREMGAARAEKIKKLYDAGLTIPQIMNLEGLSRQRVYVMLLKAGYTRRRIHIRVESESNDNE